MSKIIKFDEETVFLPGENNALIWGKTVFDPSVGAEHFKDRVITDVYITHGHADHFRQAAYLRNKGARILTSKKEAIFVEDPTINVRAMFSWAALPPKMVTRYFVGEACKVDAYTEDEKYPAVLAVPLPGHSVGHQGYLLPNKVIFSGDALWQKELWQPVPFPYMIDVNQVRASLEKLKELDYEWLVPAHGKPMNRELSFESIDYEIMRLDEIDELIIDLLKDPLRTEDLAEVLSYRLNLLNRVNQYWLTLVVLKGFLCSLHERGLIQCVYDQYQAKWRRI